MSQTLAFPVRSLLAVICAIGVAACGGGGESSGTPLGGNNNGTGGLGGTGGTGGTGGSGAATFVNLSITPGASTLVLTVGDSVKLTAAAHYSDATTHDRTQVVMWSSGATSVAPVSNDSATKGTLTGRAAGVAVITAYDGETNASASVNVIVTEAVIQSVVVTASPSTTPVGYGVQFTATATYSDNAVVDVTDLATWSSSDPAIATVSNDAATIGVATGVAPGQASIKASLPGGAEASAPLTVSEAVLESISIVAPASRIPKAVPVQLSAIATFSGSSTQDVTSFVTWSSSDPSIATVSNADGSVGVLTGTQVGTVTISVASGSVTATATLDITGAALRSIQVNASPSRRWTWVGSSTRFTATGTFSDDTLLDVSREVTWSVAPSQVAAFSRVAGKTNVAWAYLATNSTVVITAADPASGVSGTFQWDQGQYPIRPRHRTPTTTP